VRSPARKAVLDHFRWQDGHADIWRVFADGEALAAVVAGLVEPWRDQRVSHVLGIESRGFLLGGAAAVSLGVGFLAVRKAGGLLPGPKVVVEADEDYRGLRQSLRMQTVLRPGDRILLVDDWIERGSQATAAVHLVASCGAAFLGVSVVVDQLAAGAGSSMGRITSLVSANELGDPTQDR